MAEIPKLTDQEINDVIKIHPNPAELSEFKTKGREHRSLMKRLRDYIEQEFEKQWTIFTPNTNYPPNYRGAILVLDNSTGGYQLFKRTASSLTGGAPFINPVADTSQTYYRPMGGGGSVVTAIPYYSPNTLYQFGTEPVLVKWVVEVEGVSTLRIWTLKDNTTNNPNPNDYTLNPAELRAAPSYDEESEWRDVGLDEILPGTGTGGVYYKDGIGIYFGEEAGTQADPRSINVDSSNIAIGAKPYVQGAVYKYKDFVFEAGLIVCILTGFDEDSNTQNGTNFDTSYVTLMECLNSYWDESFGYFLPFSIVARDSPFIVSNTEAGIYSLVDTGQYVRVRLNNVNASFTIGLNLDYVSKFLEQTFIISVENSGATLLWDTDSFNDTPELPAWPGQPYIIEYKFLMGSNGKMNLISVSGQSTSNDFVVEDSETVIWTGTGTEASPKKANVDFSGVTIAAKQYIKGATYYYGDIVTDRDYYVTVKIACGTTQDYDPEAETSPTNYDSGFPFFNSSFDWLPEAMNYYYDENSFYVPFEVIARQSLTTRRVSAYNNGLGVSYYDYGDGIHVVIDNEGLYNLGLSNHGWGLCYLKQHIIVTVETGLVTEIPWDIETMNISTIPPLPVWAGQPYTIEYNFIKGSNGKMNLISVSGQSSGTPGTSGPTVVQTTGQSTTEVMSQKAATDSFAGKDLIIVDVPSHYTISATDKGKCLRCTSATDVTWTVPANLMGLQIVWEQKNAGKINFVGSGGLTVTNINNTFKSKGAGAVGSLFCSSNTIARVQGDLMA